MSNLIYPGKNPANPLRIAYVNALSDIGVPVWDTAVPVDIDPIPSTYILIHDFSKQINETCKDHNGWNTSILIDIIDHQPVGFLNHDQVDAIEELVTNKIALLNGFEVPGWDVEETRYRGSNPADLLQPPGASGGKNIVRTVITYENTVYEIPDVPPPVALRVYFTWSPINPQNILGSIDFPYFINIFSGAESYSMNFPDSADFNYPVVREPISEPIKTEWVNTEGLNEGFIPDSKFNASVEIGQYRYYYTRGQFFFDDLTNSLILKSNA